MLDAQELRPYGSNSDKEEEAINQTALIRVYREDQLKMENRLARAQMQIAQLELRVQALEGKKSGWKVKPGPKTTKRRRGR